MSVEWVWAGAGTETSVWVRGKVTGSSTRLVVSEAEDLSNPVFFGPVSPTSEGVVSIEATGLDPDTRYWYALEDDSVIDTAFMGTFRTHPPAGEPASFIVGAAGDAGLTGTGDDSHITNAVSNHPVFDVMRARALAEDWLQFIHLGDLHYRDISINDPDAYRQAYHDVLTFNGTLGADARQGRFYRAVPISYVWDDHDYGPNNSDRTHAGRAAAATVYREIVPHYPLPAGSGDAPIYQSWQIGRVLFVASDVRWARDPNLLPDNNPSTPKTMLGEQQKRWLERILRNSSAQALVWVMPSQWLSDQGDVRNVGISYSGADYSSDSWWRFRRERAELVDLLGDLGWLDRMVMLQADKHALSMSSGPNNPWGGFPLFMFASLDASYSDHPEGQYDIGQSPGRGRYGTLRVVDSGHTIALHGTGYIGDTVWRSYTAYAHVEPRVLALDYAKGQTFDPLEPTDDDQNLLNDFTAQRTDGSEIRYEKTDGPLSVQEPPQGVGRYSGSGEFNVHSNDDLPSIAGWQVHKGTVDEARIPNLHINLTNPRMEELRTSVAGVEPGDKITVANPPAWLPPEPIEVIAEGYEEELSTHEWHIEYNASPARIVEVATVAPQVVLNRNHSMEVTPYGWQRPGGASLWISRDYAYQGEFSLKLVPDGTTETTRVIARPEDAPRVYAGVEYEFSVWVLSPTGYAMDLSVQWLDVNNTQIAFVIVVPSTPIPAGVWTRLVGRAVAPEGAYRARPSINQRNTPSPSDVMYVDEVIFSEVGVSPGADAPNRADTSGSILQVPVDESDTEFIVATVQDEHSGARWINSRGLTETHAYEFPFNLRLGGEVVQVTACEPAGWDDFRSPRPSDSWGTSPSGHAWVDTTVPDTRLGTSTSGLYGFVQLLDNPQTVRLQTLDVGFPVQDCEILWTVRVDATASGTALLPSLVLRYQSATNYYRCRLHLNTDGTCSLSVARGTTQIGAAVNLPMLTYTGSAAFEDRIWVRTRLIGNRVLARAWRQVDLTGEGGLGAGLDWRYQEPQHWQIDREITTDPIPEGQVGFAASAFAGNTNTSPELRFQLVEIVTPQRMTVVRSVNGVVKGHGAGTRVGLNRPAIIGL